MLLEIKVDETGDFSYSKGGSLLCGISFVFLDATFNIKDEIDNLNEILINLNFFDMIHVGEMVMSRKDFKYMSLRNKKKIINSLFEFARKIPAFYYTIIIDKKYEAKNKEELKNRFIIEIRNMINRNLEFFAKFKEIKIYYDDGMNDITDILNEIFKEFKNVIFINKFDHVTDRVFQVADLLTFLDKLYYKYINNIRFSTTELNYFNYKDIKKKNFLLNNKRLK